MKLPVTIDPRLHDAVIFDLDTDTDTLVRRLTDAGIRTAVCSSNREYRAMPPPAEIDDDFAALADGTLSAEPDPAILREAADRLGARVERSVVVGDATAGVAAGRDCGFALVIGVDRAGSGTSLCESGADVVVNDLSDIAVRTGDVPMSQIPNALTACDTVAGSVGPRRPMICLDFDGTLSEIVPAPDTAVLVDGAAEALARAAAEFPVAVLSGRDLVDVQSRVNIPGLWYAGSHGFELVSPDGKLHQNAEAAGAIPVLERAVEELTAALSGITGVRVEHKRFAVAIHYRDVAPERIGTVVANAHRLGQREHLRVTNGRKVVELRPNVDWDKGTTLHWIGEQIDAVEPPLPIYLGDDLTDEDAFDAVRSTGIGILVRHGEDGDRPSSARFTLESPEEVVEFLRRGVGWTAR